MAKLNIEQPRLPGEMQEGYDLAALADWALGGAETLKGFAFCGGEIEGLSGERLEFAGCTFTRCKFAPGYIKWISFADCTFDHCELSGAGLPRALLRRCLLRDCRGVGADLGEASLFDLLAQDCQFSYLNLSMARLRCVRFSRTDLSFCALNGVKPSRLELDQCLLRGAEMGMPLKGIDLRTCDIEGIKVNGPELRGAVVSPMQACELAKLLGVVVK